MIADHFEQRGWRQVSRSALDIAEQLSESPSDRNYKQLARLVPRVSLSQDGVTRVDVEDALCRLLNDVTVPRGAAAGAEAG